MTLSIWIVSALVLAIILLMAGKKIRENTPTKKLSNNLKSKSYVFSDPEKMISQLNSSDSNINGSNHKAFQENEMKENSPVDFSEPPPTIEQNSKIKEYSIGSFILEKKKKK
jgi:hypothetical protein